MNKENLETEILQELDSDSENLEDEKKEQQENNKGKLSRTQKIKQSISLALASALVIGNYAFSDYQGREDDDLYMMNL